MVILSVWQIKDFLQTLGILFPSVQQRHVFPKHTASQKHLLDHLRHTCCWQFWWPGQAVAAGQWIASLGKACLTAQSADIKQKNLQTFTFFQLFIPLSTGKEKKQPHNLNWVYLVNHTMQYKWWTFFNFIFFILPIDSCADKHCIDPCSMALGHLKKKKKWQKVLWSKWSKGFLKGILKGVLVCVCVCTE